MHRYTHYFWKQAPALRLLVPFITGIILQWYCQLPFSFLWITATGGVLIWAAYYLLPSFYKFSLRWLQGFCIQLLMFLFGVAVTYHQDIRHNNLWVGNYYSDSSIVLATIEEPLVEKSKSYKALASVAAIELNGEWKNVKGNILLYFKRDSTMLPLKYGSQIIFKKPLQKITNSGNPGAFNYQRFCAFQDIYHQVFLRQNEYAIANTTNANWFQQWLFNLRTSVVNTLRKYIYDEREEGVAEALLIGYRDDLDKDLVQAYSNAGVVHIIAISGLHLGMIYMMLAWIFKKFKKRKWVVWVKPVVILGVLWIFSLLAGAVPSILRSAVMFTCIILGETINKKTSIYNTLAASAFAMLLYDPFYLWDVGFQLSYAAVVSIVAFMKPIHNWIYIKNKLLDTLWQWNAVTLSAQVLTLPIVLFYFHQFPNLFLITNFVIVPLSSIILFTELAVLIFAKAAIVAEWIGIICSGMLRFMNNFIERMNNLPFAVTDNIQIDVPQALTLAVTLIAFSYWMLRKNKTSLFISITSFVGFSLLQSTDILKHKQQQKLIVYNIPQHTAMDFIEGDNYKFVGDTAILNDAFLQNFHLKPSRTLHRITTGNIETLNIQYPFIQFNNKKILLVDKPFKFSAPTKIPIDLIVISKNPKLYISQLADAFDCRQYVFDGSNALWKISQWKKDCDSLHLPHHSTAEKGAFVMNLQ